MWEWRTEQNMKWEPWLISNLMHKILIYLHIIHLLKSSTCFEHYPAHPQEVYVVIMYMQPLVSSARPRTQHGCHHDTKVKPEAATAVIELLMMGGRTPETCWAVNKRQDNKLKNCWIRLVIYLNCTVMMHGLTNFKFKNDFQVQGVIQTRDLITVN